MTLSTKLALFPQTAEINGRGHLVVGGCDTVELAAEFGTPLYVFDKNTLHSRCVEFLREFGQRYADVLVIYACKAFINPTIAHLLEQEGLGLDVVSGGELHIAKSCSFPMSKVYFHGNNKSLEELRLALEWGVGRIVVDNISELKLLESLVSQMGRVADILIRVSPGIDAHTHKYITTGLIDSKFGLPIVTGQAEEAVALAMNSANFNLHGLHFHVGSSVFETAPYLKAMGVAFRFAAEMQDKHCFQLQELNCGGGFAVQYTVGDPAPPLSHYAEAITSTLLEQCQNLGMTAPRLIIEPGRAIVAQAGVALYTIGSSKDVKGIRRYIFVDGGMADNIRPALYESTYELVVANKANEPENDVVTVGGRYCESSDIIGKDVHLPVTKAGDIIAVPTSGAYSIPLASNYNAALRPAIVMVENGQAHLIRRRETYDDLLSCEALGLN